MKKTLGVLNACTPEEERAFDSLEFVNIERLLAPTGHDYRLREYRVTEGEFPAVVDECDAYLITGSPAGAYEDRDWIHALGELVRGAYTAEVPMVGICFGHQMIAQALGGRVEKFSGGWGLGLKKLEFYKRPEWMGDDGREVGDFYFCHQDQVLDLPEGAELIGGNAFCGNGMFVMGDKVFAIQAHPEFTDEVMDKTIGFVEDVVGDEMVVAAAKDSSGGVDDGAVVAWWMVRFLDRSFIGEDGH